MSRVPSELPVGAYQGRAVGDGLGDDEAVVGVAVVVVEGKPGEGLQVMLVGRNDFYARFVQPRQYGCRRRGGSFPVWSRCMSSITQTELARNWLA